jgi:hypothetical protein
VCLQSLTCLVRFARTTTQAPVLSGFVVSQAEVYKMDRVVDAHSQHGWLAPEIGAGVGLIAVGDRIAF